MNKSVTTVTQNVSAGKSPTTATISRHAMDECDREAAETESSLGNLSTASDENSIATSKQQKKRRGKTPGNLRALKKASTTVATNESNGVTKRHHTKEMITKNHHNLKDKKGVAVRAFSYLSHMSVTSQWMRYSRPLLRTLLKAWEVNRIINGMEEEREHGASSDEAVPSSSSSSSSSEGNEWLTAEEVARQLTVSPSATTNTAFTKELGILRPPKIERSAYNLLADSMDQIGQQVVLGYNSYCRKSKRSTINSLDCSSQILSIHGLKHGSLLISEIGKDTLPLERATRDKKK